MTTNYPPRKEKEKNKTSQGVTDREAIGTMGKVAIGVGAVAVVGGSFAAYYLSQPASTQTSSPSSSTLASSSSSSSSAVQSTPETTALDFTNWGYLPNVITSNITQFQSENSGLTVNSDTIPESSYKSVNEAKLASGGLLEVMENNVDTANKWYEFGWIQSLDDDPVLPNVKADMVGGTYIDSMTALDGSIIGLPYAPQAWVLFRNEKMLNPAGFSSYVPKSWDDLLSTCTQLKKSGAAQYPYNPQWGPSVYFGTPWAFYGQCNSEGEYLFDETTLEPTFDTSTPIMTVLENWQSFWNNKLVDPGVWTRQGLDMINAFATGQYAFACGTDTFRSFYSNTQTSKIAGSASISPQIPGAKGTVTNLAVLFTLATPSRTKRSAQRQQVDMDLLNFMGYKDKAGDLYADKQYFLQGGVDPSYKALYSDADVLAAVPKYYYNMAEFTSLQSLYSSSIIPRGWRAVWFADWETTVTTEIYNGVTGAETLQTCVNNLLSAAKATIKNYAGTTPSTSASTTSLTSVTSSSSS